jgi:sugar O-acyltransferase (sialic acid O-acetyltransferase NeuD family)
VIFGAGAFASLMAYYLAQEGKGRVVGFAVDSAYLRTREVNGLPVIAFEEVMSTWPPDRCSFFVAVGYSVMRARRTMFEKIKACGYELRDYISRRAVVEDDVVYGENTVVMPNAHLEPGVRLGHNNIVWSDTLIAHDTVVGDHNFIAPRCVVAGNCTIGSGCMLGVGVVVVDHTTIADETHVVPGSVVFRDTETCSCCAGNPAQVVGRHPETGIVIRRGR